MKPAPKGIERSSRSSPAKNFMTTQNYRLYSLTNYYLSSLQKGLQTAHVVSEMASKEHANAFTRPVKKAFRQWTDEDKTIIMLNGGNNANIKEWAKYFEKFSDRYPTAWFQEDDDSLAGAYTAAGIVLPWAVYSGNGVGADAELYEKLSKLSLAV